MCHQLQNLVTPMGVMTDSSEIKGFEPVCELNEIGKLMT